MYGPRFLQPPGGQLHQKVQQLLTFPVICADKIFGAFDRDLGEFLQASGPQRSLRAAIILTRGLPEMPMPEQNSEISLARRISEMGMADKIRLALTGDKEARTLLSRDKNKLILAYIIQNPRITEHESLQLAADRTTPEETLVAISRKKDWMKRYPLRLVLCQNPKTPLPLALRLLRTVMDADLRRIARSKDVSVHLSSVARRILVSRGLL